MDSILRLDDKCAYSDMIAELSRKVEENGLEGLAEVQVQTGSRYCNEDELKEIMTLFIILLIYVCQRFKVM